MFIDKRVNIVNMSVLHNLIYRFNAISIKKKSLKVMLFISGNDSKVYIKKKNIHKSQYNI